MRNGLFILLLLCLPVQAAEVIRAENPVLRETCGRGALFEMAGQKVLILQGDHYQMGCPHGRLKLWASSAAAVGTPNYQAAYQPYFEFDVAELLALERPQKN